MISKSAGYDLDHALGDRLPAMDAFAAPIDDARVDQLRNPGRHHLGMQAQVMLAIECPHCGHFIRTCYMRAQAVAFAPRPAIGCRITSEDAGA